MTEAIPLLNRSSSTLACPLASTLHEHSDACVKPLTFFEAAQQGNLVALIENLSSSSKPTDLDADSCTALHWAALNAHIHIAKHLIDCGANPNRVGGALAATPMQWAARSGHLEMCVYLVSRGADACLLDSQGFNCLFVAVHSGNLMLVLYFIAVGVDVDSKDKLGRTPLMWACYQGSSLEIVESILSFDPELNYQDSTGYTALHWSISSNQLLSVSLLHRNNAQLDIKEANGKTAADLACERGQLKEYRFATRDRSHSFNNRFTDDTTNRIIFGMGVLTVPVGVAIMEVMHWYYGLLVCFLALALSGQVVIGTLLLGGQYHLMSRTPFLMAIACSSIFCATINWVRMLPYIGLNFTCVFVTAALLTSIYSIYKTSTLDPGIIPKETNEAVKKETILMLAGLNELDTRRLGNRLETIIVLGHSTAVRLQFYSTYLLVGERNHIYFMFFVLSMVVGVPPFIPLSIKYMSLNTTPLDPSIQCLFTPTICQYMHHNTFCISMTIQLSFHCLWTGLLLAMQLYQVSVAKTTNEFANSHRLEYYVHPEDKDVEVWKRREFNPFDEGVVRNCVEFWSGKRQEAVYRVSAEALARGSRRQQYSNV